ncbi:MAG: MupA/Atu3671 family FMN-dependent luciferase-like monooxygenase, partial [Myxococcota bacterium]
DQKVGEVRLLDPDEYKHIIYARNQTEVDFPFDTLLHEWFWRLAEEAPDALAVTFEDQTLTASELCAHADSLARQLLQEGVKPGEPVAVCFERSTDLVVSLFGVLRAGAAYVPIDPALPPARCAFMCEDAGIRLAVAPPELTARVESCDTVVIPRNTRTGEFTRAFDTELPRASSTDPAYIIYTSGSTGTPKAVVIEHEQTANFIQAMDKVLGAPRNGVWLSTTTVSFDISVLEIFWALGRGMHVVLQRDQSLRRSHGVKGDLDFGLFYFGGSRGVSSAEQYRLLIEGARRADESGFKAVWTPERHFDDFGDLYPNPSVTSAALAAATQRIQIRAGSVVAPLHDPIRIFEDWSVIDNISKGRIGISFASGWHVNDFVLAPNSYNDRRKNMLETIETVRSLWAGHPVERINGAGHKTMVTPRPRPVQKELPLWVTAAGNIETFKEAGRMGANVLTHLLGQSPKDLEAKIEAYRQARSENGHEPAAGKVSLMLHTFVTPDPSRVKAVAAEPFRAYLRTSAGLIERLATGISGESSTNRSAED